MEDTNTTRTEAVNQCPITVIVKEVPGIMLERDIREELMRRNL